MLFAGAWWIYDRYLPRSIVVEADTGYLEIDLTAQMDGKTFPDALVCRRLAAPDLDARPGRLGCPRRTHELVREAFFAQVLPEGTRLSVAARPGAVQLRVLSVPDRYTGTDVARLVGGGVTMTGEALAGFGSLNMRGIARIGALHADTERVSTIAGHYQVSGLTLMSGLDDDMRVLRRGELLAGALVRFTHRGEETEARIYATLPDIATGLLRVTATSRGEPDDLTVRYYFTDDVEIRPTLVEALIADPIIQLLIAVLGATAGFGWLRHLAGFDRTS